MEDAGFISSRDQALIGFNYALNTLAQDALLILNPAGICPHIRDSAWVLRRPAFKEKPLLARCWFHSEACDVLTFNV
jgi:hypothetical protein